MLQEPEVYLTNEEMLSLDQELFGSNNPLSFLRPCFIHFTENNHNNCIQVLRAKMYGATVCDITSPNLTHVVIPKTMNDEELDALKIIKNAFVVSEDWLNACIEKKMIVSETDFVYNKAD